MTYGNTPRSPVAGPFPCLEQVNGRLWRNWLVSQERRGKRMGDGDDLGGSQQLRII